MLYNNMTDSESEETRTSGEKVGIGGDEKGKTNNRVKRCSAAVRRILVTAIGKTGSAMRRLVRRKRDQLPLVELKLQETDINAVSMSHSGLLDVSEISSSKPKLVIDLDETLLHSANAPISNYDHYFEYHQEETGRKKDVFVRYRPFMHDFLHFMSRHYDLIVYTASSQAVSALSTVRRPSHRPF